LSYWFKRTPRPPQWWWEQIGQPQYIGAILVLMYRSYTSVQLQQGLAMMAQANNFPNMMGQNKVWEQQIVINAAALTRDSALATKTFVSMWAGVQVTTGDGPQVDGSFHLHGPQLYTGEWLWVSFVLWIASDRAWYTLIACI
jgi:chondroitin AC lyase